MAETRPAPPHGRYRRCLDGADFSIQANTEDVPADGRFYVMQAGEVVMASEDFEEATTAYHKLCNDFWRVRLEDDSLPVRIAAAWGILGLDSADKTAIAVITRDGSAQERKRLDQAQSRRRALRSRAQAEQARAQRNAATAAANAANAAALAAEKAAALLGTAVVEDDAGTDSDPGDEVAAE